MATALTYTGDAGRYYPHLGLVPEPGTAYGASEGLTLDERGNVIAPDERWVDPASDAAAAAAAAQASPAQEPASSTPAPGAGEAHVASQTSPTPTTTPEPGASA